MTKYRIIRLPLPTWVKSPSVMPVYQLDKKTIFSWTTLHQFNARSFGEAYKIALAVLQDRNPDDYDENNIMEFEL